MLAYAAATGLAYALLAQVVAGVTALGDSTGATFWPGAGLTLGVLLARPRREWPLHLIAVFLAEMLMDVKFGYGWELGMQWAAVNALEPFIGAAVLTRGGRRALDIAQPRDLARFIGLGVIVGPACGGARRHRGRRSARRGPVVAAAAAVVRRGRGRCARRRSGSDARGVRHAAVAVAERGRRRCRPARRHGARRRSLGVQRRGGAAVPGGAGHDRLRSADRALRCGGRGARALDLVFGVTATAHGPFAHDDAFRASSSRRCSSSCPH
jgi:hypothetical protein